MKTIKSVLLVTLLTGFLLPACSGASSGNKNDNINKEDKIVDTQGVIKLNDPDKTMGKSLMQALDERKSIREFANKEITLTDLSNLLWAANGINRPDQGKRTAPSAVNAQDVDIYVCMKDGAYLYNAKENALQKVTGQDLRSAVAGAQDFVLQAPVSLLLVSDISRFPGDDNIRKQLLGAMDAGIVSQNISLYCASAGLATVPRASMDMEVLKKALNLPDNILPMMNHPVGYGK